MSTKKIDWMTVAEVAAEFGVSKSVIERACHDGKILNYRFGAKSGIRIPRWWVDRELERYRRDESVEQQNTRELAEKGRLYAAAIAEAQKLGLA